jgi:hypothetical protein
METTVLWYEKTVDLTDQEQIQFNFLDMVQLLKKLDEINQR